jgi:hypothetical protein
MAMYELIIARIADKPTREAMFSMMKEMHRLRGELDELKSRKPPTFEHFPRQDLAYRSWQTAQADKN